MVPAAMFGKQGFNALAEGPSFWTSPRLEAGQETRSCPKTPPIPW